MPDEGGIENIPDEGGTESILNDVKKFLGLQEDYTAFDQDILININGSLSTLQQLGVGPDVGFVVVDETTQWSDFSDDSSQLHASRLYICLKTKLVFDPPSTGYLVTSYEKQIQELEWRLNTRREETEWIDPMPTVILEGELYDG